MADKKTIRLQIRASLFNLAFNRDVDYHDAYPKTAFLDSATGEVHWIYNEDDDAETEGIPASENEACRHQMAESPARYLVIPGRAHVEHHHMLLREFLDSEWTNDSELRVQTKSAYNGSIGGWKKLVSRDVYFAFCDYRDGRLEKMAEEFLKNHGIEADWK